MIRLLFSNVTTNDRHNQERTSLPRDSTDPIFEEENYSFGEAHNRNYPAKQNHGRHASDSLIFKDNTEVVVVL